MRDVMTMNGTKFACPNLDLPVGKGQPNRKYDVMLVQAMLQKLAKGHNNPGFLGVPSWDDVPDPSGNFEDGKTEKAIWSYQRKNARILLKVDGKVHPAAYADRNMKPTGPDWQQMMITLMHLELINTAVLAGWGDDYRDEIRRTVPELSPYI